MISNNLFLNVPPLTDVLDITHTHPDYPLDEATLQALVRRVATGEGWSVTSLGIILTDHQTVHALNKTYLGHDDQTDVLAFPLGDTPGTVDGEVYVDLDTAAERAPEFGVSYKVEAYRYIIHGLLHLMAYSDRTPEEKARMHALEDHYLEPINIEG